ncbi:carboxylesterase/lipase family protein [Rhodococcus rhodnii]|uniref:Carboxylic ester hydrolase n=2 Tax=Rhodococcus rhodnii TaxID=38312 RepID=R7WP48_9NOCA|nr:carboxylesterase/lipase family protein [Rhodococcus rhodnii]EOM75754.1 carboxylesterase [Rhodococcus rhodnii LMG 5362]TXG90165.1 carboxylesterase/lipase family protein [Rhodococcus rhodnii]
MTTAETDPLIATTTEGLVRGRRVDELLAFRGIPYAAPPVGPLRFRAPEPHEPWDGVRDATEYGTASFQPQQYTRTGLRTVHPIGEDALTLNVLAKPGGRDARRPVMVFVHGGAYSLGMSATPLYRGLSLVRRADVVFVSINYRLGVLGYLDFSEFSTPTRCFDSNLGLRDQVAALAWAQRNIAEFGGDPANVTVFGESAGGDAVTTLLATPAAGGLFARAIAESPAPALTAPADRARSWAKQFFEFLDVDADPATALDTADPELLGKAGARLTRAVVTDTPGLAPFGPVVDGDYLPEAPLDAVRSGRAHRVPLVIGTNANEGTLFPRFLDALPTSPERIEEMFARTDPEAGRRVTGAYPGYPDDDAAIAIGGDLTFWLPSVEIAEAHSRFAPTYMYRYDFAPRLLRLLRLHATHALELFAVFGEGDSVVGRLLTALGGRRGLRAVSSS